MSALGSPDRTETSPALAGMEPEARPPIEAVDLRTVLDASTVGVAVVAASGEILALSRTAAEIFDVTEVDRPRLAPELLDRLAVTWPDGRGVVLHETPFRRALRGETVRDVLLSLAPPGQPRRWVLASATPLGPPGPIHSVVLNVVDVTCRRERQEDCASLLRHLFEELHPRVEAIARRAQELRDGGGGLEATAARGREILRAARRLSAGLQDLEAALRFDGESIQATPELVDVKAFVLDLLERDAGELDLARIVTVIPAGLPRAYVDPDHLERITLELLRGALAGASGADLAVSYGGEPGALRMTVASDHPDVPPADLPRVFDRFFKTRGRPVGSLHVVRALAEANAGWVAAEGVAGRRLAIHVALPARVAG